jgi:iron complex outermembrane recepter protein
MSTIKKCAAPRSLSGFSLLSLALVASPVVAADEATVFVSGNRFDSTSAQTVGATSVITAVDIARSSASTLAEVLAKLGGVHVRNNAGDPNWQVDLRGFGMTGDQNTLILLDGQRISENELTPARLTAIPLNAIDRIEIMRGSGAVMFGHGATGGTINIITRKPGDGGKAGTLSASAGSYGTTDVRASLEANQGPVSLMLNASDYASDNYRTNNHVHVRSLEGALRAGGTDRSVALRFGTARQLAGFPAERTTAQYASDPSGTRTPNDSGLTKTWHAGLGFQMDTGFGDVAVDANFRNKNLTNYFPSAPIYSWSDTDAMTFSPRARFKLGAGELVVGADLSDWRYAQNNISYGTPGAAAATRTGSAVFAKLDMNLREGLQMTAGLRNERTVDSFTRPATSSKTVNLQPYEFGLRQAIAVGWSGYGKLGKSYRLATIDENYDSFANTVTILRPQKSEDAELGLEWRAGKRSLRTSWFQSDLTDEIHLVSTPGAGFANTSNRNLSPSQRRGFEAEGRWQASPEIEFGGNYRYTTAKFVSGTYFGIDLRGKEVPLVPRHVVSANGSWRVATGQVISGAWRYVGTQRYDNDQVNAVASMPSYQVADLKYSVASGAWVWAASIDNIFDKRYFSYGIRNNAGTSNNVYPELGRKVMLSAELKL